MTNKEFEDTVLNHRYINFYRDSVINLYAVFITQGKSSADSRYEAIAQSQYLVEEMGYTNPSID